MGHANISLAAMPAYPSIDDAPTMHQPAWVIFAAGFPGEASALLRHGLGTATEATAITRRSPGPMLV
jgi:hypothetical protein